MGWSGWSSVSFGNNSDHGVKTGFRSLLPAGGIQSSPLEQPTKYPQSKQESPLYPIILPNMKGFRLGKV